MAAGGVPSAIGGDAQMFLSKDNEDFGVSVNNLTVKPNFTDRTSKHIGEVGERQDQVIMSYEIAGEMEIYSSDEMRLVRACWSGEVARSGPRVDIVVDFTTPDGLSEQDSYPGCRVQLELNFPAQDQAVTIPFRAFCNAADAQLGVPTA